MSPFVLNYPYYTTKVRKCQGFLDISYLKIFVSVPICPQRIAIREGQPDQAGLCVVHTEKEKVQKKPLAAVGEKNPAASHAPRQPLGLWRSPTGVRAVRLMQVASHKLAQLR
jgi:hypothetical protein